MIKFARTVAAALLMTAVTLATASAAEQGRKEAGDPVRTASVTSPAISIVHRSKPAGEPAERQQESNGWGMLAAGLCVGMLIIARRRRG